MRNLNNNTDGNSDVAKMQYVAETLAPGPIGFLLVIANLFSIWLGWLSLASELIFRRRFGERYLTILRILMAWVSVLVFRDFYYIVGGLITALQGGFNLMNGGFDFSGMFRGSAASNAFTNFTYAFWILAALHLMAIWVRNANGQAWHSHSFGVSWFSELPWNIWNHLVDHLPTRFLRSWLHMDDWKLYILVEPVIAYLIGRALGTSDSVLGLWLQISSFTLLVKNMMVYLEMRGRILDSSDANIEAFYMEDSLAGVDKRETAGFEAVPVDHVPVFKAPAMNLAHMKSTVEGVMANRAAQQGSGVGGV